MISLPLYGHIFDEVGKATFPIPDQFMAPIKSAEAPKITNFYQYILFFAIIGGRVSVIIVHMVSSDTLRDCFSLTLPYA